MRGFPHQAHAGCGRIPFMPINGLRSDMKRKNGENVPAAVRIGSPSVPRCLCIGQGVTFVKLMLSDGVALYPCACRRREPEPSLLGNRQCTPCAYPRPPVRWGNPCLQAMRISTSGPQQGRSLCAIITCACPCVIPQWLRRQSGDCQASHPLEGK